MVFGQEPVLAYLEEDNITRSFFRLIPLCSLSSAWLDGAAERWPDLGSFRLVPDRNEQGYFKDRMRGLGSFCMIDLTSFPPTANKIRTNKNYHDGGEEKNQLIIYSDAVRELAEHAFYQVLTGQSADIAALADASVTPYWMLQDGDRLIGPISRQDPVLPEETNPMEVSSYTLTCPDGIERVFLCRADAIKQIAPEQSATGAEPEASSPKPDQPASAPAKKTETPAALPLGKKLDILDPTVDFDTTIAQLNQPLSQSANRLQDGKASFELHDDQPVQRSLTGTPLVPHRGLRCAVQKNKNHVQEAVHQKMGRNDDLLAAPLPADAKLERANNPVEAACRAFTLAWRDVHAQQPLVNHVLSQPGILSMLNPAVCGKKKTALQHAMNEHLTDLEAERLTALVQLDQAKNELESFRRQAIADARTKEKAELTALESQHAQASEKLQTLHREIAALCDQKSALEKELQQMMEHTLPNTMAESIALANMMVPESGMPLHFNCKPGLQTTVGEAADRLVASAAEEHCTLPRNQAIALLAMMQSSERFLLCCPTPATCRSMTERLAKKLGWDASFRVLESSLQRPIAPQPMAHETPALMLTMLPDFYPVDGIHQFRIIRTADATLKRSDYEIERWPIMKLPAIPMIRPAVEALSPIVLPAVSQDEIDQLRTRVEPIFAEWMQRVAPLSAKSYDDLLRFVALSAPDMDGGLAAACDWAISLWFAPLAKGEVSPKEACVSEYPTACTQL